MVLERMNSYLKGVIVHKHETQNDVYNVKIDLGEFGEVIESFREKRIINIMEIKWKTKQEIPTERWERNSSISPKYLVKCGYDKEGLPILGYTNYSYATNSWMKCYKATEEGIFDVEEWTDIRL